MSRQNAIRNSNPTTARLKRTANLPSAGAMSICFWLLLSVDRNDFSPWLYRTNNSFGQYLYWGTGADGTTTLADVSGTSGTGASLTIGQWYHAAYTANGTAHTFYLNGASDIAITQTLTPTNDQITLLGDEPDGIGINGKIADIRMWDAALTLSELQAEMRSAVPISRPQSLNGYYETKPLALRGLDSSPKRNNFAQVGTLGDEAGPPLPALSFRRRVARANAVVTADRIWPTPVIVPANIYHLEV